MSKTAANGLRSTVDQTRHCKEDALSDREFERLVEATHDLDDDYFAIEARLILFCAGRLGLRAGEIRHMDESWIDWRRQMIQIPRDQHCTLGKDGGLCGSCRQSARQMARYHEHVDVEEAAATMWQPKTEAAAREVPLDATTRAALALEDYFDRFDRFQTSQTGINRRVNRTAELADGLSPDAIYPHCLRATAASYWSARDLGATALKSLMGWSDFSVALNYIEESGERTAKALRSISQ